MRSVLSVSLPEKMAAELDVIAKDTGRNKSDIVKESLGQFLWENRFRRMKKRLIPKAKAAGYVTDDSMQERKLSDLKDIIRNLPRLEDDGDAFARDIAQAIALQPPVGEGNPWA